MNTDIHSYNSSVGPSLKRFLLPSLPLFWLELMISLLLLVAFNARALWSYFTTGILAVQKFDLGDLINQKARGLHDFLNSIAQGRLLQIIFWLLIGCMVYLIIWFVGNLITNIRNDVVADNYLHPKSYNRAIYWQSVIARKVLFWSLVLTLFFYIFSWFRITIVLAKFCYSSLASFDWGQSLSIIVVSTLVTAILLHLFIVLAHIIINSWRFIYRDL